MNEETAPAVVIMARAPRRGEVRRALEPEIGPGAALALHAALLLQAAEWARALMPRAIYVAHEPADGATETRRLFGNDVVLFPQNGEGISGRVADAVTRTYSRSPGPVLLVWPSLPALRHSHGEAAISDLAEGVDIVLGPLFDGGFYLVGVSKPLPVLFTLPETAWRGPDARNQLLAAASEAKLDVGLLRPERGLQRPADIRAALVDPTLPEAVARALSRRGQGSTSVG